VNELTALDVARRLARALADQTPARISAETGTPVAHLAEMTEMRREFPRNLLRYLGVREAYIEITPAPEWVDGWYTMGSGVAHWFHVSGIGTLWGDARSHCRMAVRDHDGLIPAQEPVWHCRRCEAVIAAERPAA
jgi:hypothetical protein